jgi:hypothetical protein
MLPRLSLKSQAAGLEEVSTGSGSDLVSDEHAIFLKFFDSDRSPGRYRSLY